MVTGNKYTFRVITVNFNGKSTPSTSFTYNACTVPSGMQAPVRIDLGSTTNNLIIRWQEPKDDGGCPITGYSVYRDDSRGSAVNIEINKDSDPAIRGNPVLR